MRSFSLPLPGKSKYFAGHNSFGYVLSSMVHKCRYMSSSSCQYTSCFGPYDGDSMQPVDEYLDSYPLLREVRPGRLIQVDPRKPYLASERGKRFIWSAMNILNFFHKRHMSTAGLFRRATLGVIKPLGLLAVKGYTPISDGQSLSDQAIRSDYAEAIDYIVSLLVKKYGSDIKQHLLKDLSNWLTKVENLKAGFDPDEVSYDACLLPKESRGPLGVELYMYLRRDLLLKQQYDDIDNILESMSSKSLTEGWPDNVNNHVLLDHWAPYDGLSRNRSSGIHQLIVGEEMKEKKSGLLSQLFATQDTQLKKMKISFAQAVLDLHRHAYVHAFERRVIELIQDFFDDKFPDLSSNYTIWDVIDLLQYEFPELFPQALMSIKLYRTDLWLKINMKSRFPVWPFSDDCSDGPDSE